MSKETTSYTIQRSIKPIVMRVVSLVLVTDALLLMALLLIVSLRNILGVDAQLIGLAVVLFSAKTLFTIYSVYSMMQSWLGVTYYVVEDKLYAQSDVKSVSSKIYRLEDISSVIADQAYWGPSGQDYGTVRITFVRSTKEKDIVLQGVKNPDTIANQLSKASK